MPEPELSAGESDPTEASKRNRTSKVLILVFLLSGLGFCGYYLYSSDKLYVPERIAWDYFLLGVAVAVLGHVADGASWRFTLRGIGEKVPLRICVSATAFAVLGKYIPGKIWMLAGRVMYLRRYAKVSLSQVTSAVVFLQIAMLWVGLAIGLVFSPFSAMHKELLWAGILFLFLGGGVLAFWGSMKRQLARRVSFFEKIPEMGLEPLLAVSLCTLLTWLLWSTGFVISARSVYPEALPISSFGAFPLAAVFGILAIVLPGGIGVREGIIVGVLLASGLPLEIASTLAIVSRLWFLASELVFALLGLFLHFLPRARSTEDCAQGC